MTITLKSTTTALKDTNSGADARLINVRCPFHFKIKKNGAIVACNKLIVRTSPNSYGEAYCWRCRLKFDYKINGEEFTSIVKVKKK